MLSYNFIRVEGEYLNLWLCYLIYNTDVELKISVRWIAVTAIEAPHQGECHPVDLLEAGQEIRNSRNIQVFIEEFRKRQKS